MPVTLHMSELFIFILKLMIAIDVHLLNPKVFEVFYILYKNTFMSSLIQES